MAKSGRTIAALATALMFAAGAVVPTLDAGSAAAADVLTPRSLGMGSRTPLLARSTAPERVPFTRSRLVARVPSTTSAGGATANATAPTFVVGTRSTFDVSFDAGFTAHPDAALAFLAAVHTWADAMYSPVALQIQADFQDMGNNSVLGAGGPNDFMISIPGGRANTAYPVALADAMDGKDYEGNAPDIVVTLNSKFPSWYFGIDGKTAATEWDFETVVLHELGHGLGFVSSFTANGDLTGDGTHTCPAGAGCYGAYPDFPIPFVFDRLTTTGASSGTALVSNPEASAGLEAALTSGNVYWSGTEGVAGAGGVRPQLYAPSPWEGGSSASHLDEKRYPKGDPNSLMTPVFNPGEAQHSIGPIALGMLDDLGWNESEQFVDAAYHDLVGRAPSARERAVAAKLSSGSLSRYSFAFGLANSTAAVSNRVQALYLTVFGRAGDRAGLAYWTQKIRSGQETPAQVGAQFYAATDTSTNATRAALTMWVAHLYQGILGRNSDSRGVAYWARVAQARGPLVVATALYQSLEWRQRRVTTLYLAYLRRLPDSSGLTYWSHRLLTMSDIALTAQLVQTDSYYLRAQSRPSSL